MSYYLVPTRVGMIPPTVEKVTAPEACPHTRGDDPVTSENLSDFVNLSPHAWG